MKKILFIVAVSSYFFYSCDSEKTVELYCTNMLYACGDCYPNYRIDSIEKTNRDLHLIGKEIEIIFKDKNMLETFENSIGFSPICYHYSFKGHFKCLSQTKFLVESYTLFYKEGCISDSTRQ